MDPFLLRLALSFALGGGTVAAFTTIAERGGSRLGGLLLSFPVKVTISLVLIALNEGISFAATSATAVPAGIGVNIVFLVATALLVRTWRPWPAILGALAIWAATGLLVILYLPDGLTWSLAVWILLTLLGLSLLARIPNLRGEKRSTTPITPLSWPRLILRGCAAGSVVAGSIIVAHYGGPILGGLASVFPSGFITTMVILTRKHGADYTGATVRVMVAGTAAPSLFGAAIAFAYPELGVFAGTLVCMAMAAGVTFSVSGLLRAADGAQEDDAILA